MCNSNKFSFIIGATRTCIFQKSSPILIKWDKIIFPFFLSFFTLNMDLWWGGIQTLPIYPKL
jgi:hypothetical protein